MTGHGLMCAHIHSLQVATMGTSKTAIKAAIDKHGMALCLEAYQMQSSVGEGCNAIGSHFGITTNQASAAARAGEALIKESISGVFMHFDDMPVGAQFHRDGEIFEKTQFARADMLRSNRNPEREGWWFLSNESFEICTPFTIPQVCTIIAGQK